jgi:magnesium transporter
MLGTMLAAVAFPAVALLFSVPLAVVISLTLVCVCTWASFAGGILPPIANRVGIDPAVVSTPLIATLVDATGLVIYFLVAHAVLAGELGAPFSG